MRKIWRLALLASISLCGWVWSPEAIPAGEPVNTEQIAFLRLSSVYWQVCIMKPDGSSQKQLTRSPVDKVHMAWRPGTNELLYQTNQGKAFLLDLETGNEKLILEGIDTRHATWSPDGKRLAYETSPRDESFGKSIVWVSDLGGTNRQRVADTILWAAAPVWLSDQVLLYTRSTLLPSFEMKHDFRQLELGSTEDQPLMEGDDEPRKFDAAAFTRNGKSLIACTSLESGFYEIWILDRAGGGGKQISRLQSYSGNPCWSPDGASISFESDASGKCQIYRSGVDGRGLKQLTHDGAPSRKPVWIASTQSAE